MPRRPLKSVANDVNQTSAVLRQTLHEVRQTNQLVQDLLEKLVSTDGVDVSLLVNGKPMPASIRIELYDNKENNA